jgi:hypothetical protein
MTKIVPIRPPVRSRLIVHCHSDEFAAVGAALIAIAKRGGMPEGGNAVVVEDQQDQTPSFCIERKRTGPGTLVMWSQALVHRMGRIRA